MSWPLGRVLLHCGDPDLAAITVEDLDELREAVAGFLPRLEAEGLRDFYARPGRRRPGTEPTKAYFVTATARIRAAHTLRFQIGQVVRPPAPAVSAGTWTTRLAPADAPPRIAAVVERYLRLHLQANLDRPQTVRHSRDALARLLRWLVKNHPEVDSLDHEQDTILEDDPRTSPETRAPLDDIRESIEHLRQVAGSLPRD